MQTTATTYYEKNTASDLKWYAGQNSKFVARYVRVHANLRIGDGADFFSDLFESLGGSEYCSAEPTWMLDLKAVRVRLDAA